jgi:2-(1,2-epoxy-1,2-dihydrophenyl)acetyl-CoA isomerase
MEFIETPVIAAINGAAIGAGLDFSCMCDVRICSDKAKFGETFVKLGLIPGDGGAFFLQRVVGYPKAMELTLTGDVINADEALDIGLVMKSVAPESLMEEAVILATKVAKNAPVAVRYSKKLIRQAYHDRISSHLESAAVYQGVAQRTSDHFEGVCALLEKRSAKFEGR